MWEEKMFVSKSMTRKVITIDPEAGILEAQDLMTQHHIRHLPVIDADSKVIGIITDRDIRSAVPYELIKHHQMHNESEKLAAIKVKEIMTADPIVISSFYTIQDALLLIQSEKVGAFPVVDEEGKLKGILSVRDLIEAFINVLGIGQPGTLLGVLSENKIGQMKKIVDAITEENISFGSILVARYGDKEKRAIFPYLFTNTVGPVKRKLGQLGFEILDPAKWYLDQLPTHKD
jgi:acetoin utilization protein AcuB